MPRKPVTTVNVDLAPVIASIQALVDRAVASALSQSIAVVSTPAKPAKAPRKPKAAKQSAPKVDRAPRADIVTLGGDIARSMRVGHAYSMGELEMATGATPAAIRRALATIPGLVTTGAKRGTRYSLANVAEIAPMGEHVNGTQASA